MSVMGMAEPEYEPSSTPDGSGGGATRGGDGGGPTAYDGQSLAQVLDDILGAYEAPRAAEAGPASSFVAEALPLDYSPDAFLAGLFWRLASETYGSALDYLGATPSAEQIVVGHANATRFDLLLMEPTYGGDPQGTNFYPSHGRYFIAEPNRLQRIALRSGLDVPSAILVEAVQEQAVRGVYGIAIVQAPDQEETGCLTPALAIETCDNETEATVGLFLHTAEGDHLATTANHAVPEGTVLRISGGEKFEVVERD